MFILPLVWSLFFASPAPPHPQLVVTVTGVPSAGGDVLLGVWDADGEFLSDRSRRAGKVLPAATGSVRFTLDELPRGRYAISVLHDKDRNGKMTKSLLGWPVEAYGFSNNARGLFGAPDFSDCVFELREATELTIALK